MGREMGVYVRDLKRLNTRGLDVQNGRGFARSCCVIAARSRGASESGTCSGMRESTVAILYGDAGIGSGWRRDFRELS